MSGKKPSTVQGFIVTREFRGVALYLTSIHTGKGMRWLADRARAMVISDAQDALAVSERASREWGTKAFVATTDEAPHIVERAKCAGSLMWPKYSRSTNVFYCERCGHNFTRGELQGRDDHMPTHLGQVQS